MEKTMVMVTREEFEELVKLRILKANVVELYSPEVESMFTCVELNVLKKLFPGEFVKEEANV